MAAIWGISATTDRWGTDALVRRAPHRGVQEFEWVPAPHVRFAWRQDDAAPVSVALPRAPLMFVGMITNRDELSQHFGRRAIDTSSRSDAELLWKLYGAAGPNAFAQITGQFAVALYDQRTDEVVLATDRRAAQPLYLARIESCWAFATEYRALLALRVVAPCVDSLTVAALNATRHLHVPQDLLADVHPVAPGEIARISHDGACIRV